jgi:carbonic anhydrase
MKRVLSHFLLVACIVSGARSQDMKNVIAIVRQMESELKAMVEQEKHDRQSAYAEILTEIQALKISNHEAPVKTVEQKEKNSAKEFIARLQEGNRRFVEGKLASKDFAHQRAELTKGQKPFVIVLTCSDSRVSPEFIFDESLGQIFVVRVAGNVADSVALGSIEYAAEHLRVGLLLVLGHDHCGAVEATIAGGEISPNVGSLAWRIKPAVERARATHVKEDDALKASITENVFEQMKQVVQQSDVLNEMVEKGELSIAGGVYDLASGNVRFLSQDDFSQSTSVRHDTMVSKIQIHPEKVDGH